MEFKLTIEQEDLEDYIDGQLESNYKAEITGMKLKDNQLIIEFIIV